MSTKASAIIFNAFIFPRSDEEHVTLLFMLIHSLYI